VQKSPEIGTKCARKECEVPVPAKLVKKLKAWKVKSDKTCKLMFPTSGCNPNLDFLDCLKACAERAELDKDNFWLHKFRSTLPLDAFAPAWICGPCSNGSVTAIWNRPCGI